MKIRSFNVIPKLPKELEPLRDIAMNLWSSWNWKAAQLFIRLDADTWEACRQNLVMTLGRLPRNVLDEAAADDSFLAYLNSVKEELDDYLAAKTWFREHCVADRDSRVAYFSMEFGLDVGLPIYSGGLGVLSGDHLKSSSDLGIPLTGIGLLYQRGYFQQYLNSDGWQMERYPVNDWYNMPVELQRNAEGEPLNISVEIENESLHAHIWKVQVGRIPLYLLDANIPDNPPHLRQITAQLYGGDRDNRIRQEILLGIGGIRALRALDIHPTVFHMNEGHSAFLVLERMREYVQNQGLSFAEAREAVWASTVFTTHTPVPAGNEAFTLDRIERSFSKYSKSLGINWQEFLALGQEPGNTGQFSMTVLALKHAAHCNGVSKLHGRVSRQMWKSLWPELPENEIPIRHITNGVHTRTWISHEMNDLVVRYIGPQFVEEPHNHDLWDRIDRIPDLELWRIHQIRKERLIFFARKRLRIQLERRGVGMKEVQEASEVLNSSALTFGFARRFATYKRATLLFREPERLKRLLTDPKRPVQFIFAGKAHPHDDAGKQFIREVVHFAADAAIRPRIVFIEDYDINVARYMAQGVDVWLSNPQRPLEASGTSGMKAAANGALNLSTLDGWWDEAYDPTLGWAIGSGEESPNSEELSRIESEALYNLLEHDIIPLYFDLDRSDVPRQWIAMMKRSLSILGRQFNTHRMVMEYCDLMYQPAHRAQRSLMEKEFAKSKALASWRAGIAQHWAGVALVAENNIVVRELAAGDELKVRARVKLNGLKPDDVAVEALYGALDPDDRIVNGALQRLTYQGEDNGEAIFEAPIVNRIGGRHGYALRIRPDHPDLVHSFMPLLLRWE